ncbi:hypothetical protein Acr_29g0009660 [Actinidia rufa]|uniref:Protein FAR1-RELATED SEQUENCE n=1 Tax=Actinidia rufa TaxID=165716 RepID=A0A7J0HGD0_9ERIC|nr:hypothetical protein Acr_29g0009660 [Actinidia rufa]
MLNWVRSVGRQNGMVVVIKRSANLKGGKLPKCILGCERGGKYEPPRHHSEGQPLQRNTRTKKCDCPFELRGLAIPPDGVMWGLLVKCGFHNHETAKYLDGHEYPSRPKPVEKQFVVEMAGSTKPREILNVLKERDSANTTGIQSIYNTIAKQKVVQRGGLNPTQHVLDQLISKRYLHAFMTNPATNEITDIVWVHPKSLDLFINFPTVLIIDAMYKTNEYRIPLLELQYANTASPFLAGYCNCTIKVTHGLPCMHDLAHYRSLCIPIPLSDIDSHWSRLCMDPSMRDNMITRIIDMTDPSHSTIRSPAYNTEHRGRPADKNEQSRRRIPSIPKSYTSGSRGASNSSPDGSITLPATTSRLRKDQPTTPPMSDPFIQELPEAYQDFISHIVDVQADGHCGFRAIAAQIGYGEDNWAQVRMDLIEEIQTNMELYNVLYPEYNYAKHSSTFTCLVCTNDATGILDGLYVIGSCHRIKILSSTGQESPREIAIARIRGNHFVQVFLRPHYLVPPTPLWWRQHVTIEARG